MEKRKPTYDLASFQQTFASSGVRLATRTAIRDATGLGFDEQDMASAIASMERTHFFKSMTSYADHTVWQDVYYVPFEDLTLYVKFTADLITEFRLLSFKET